MPGARDGMPGDGGPIRADIAGLDHGGVRNVDRQAGEKGTAEHERSTAHAHENGHDAVMVVLEERGERKAREGEREREARGCEGEATRRRRAHDHDPRPSHPLLLLLLGPPDG